MSIGRLDRALGKIEADFSQLIQALAVFTTVRHPIVRFFALTLLTVFESRFVRYPRLSVPLTLKILQQPGTLANKAPHCSHFLLAARHPLGVLPNRAVNQRVNDACRVYPRSTATRPIG